MKAKEQEKGLWLKERYVEFDYNKALICSVLLVLISFYLAFDNFTGKEKNIGIGQLASFCTVSMMIACILLLILKKGTGRRPVLEACACFLISIVFWITHGWFLYSGGTGGTSIFLLFSSAPVAFLFFNLFYGSIFCLVEYVGMSIYMGTSLHQYGYQFPEMYYQRLPLMYLIEVVLCMLAQFETVKARTRQDEALLEARKANEAKTDFLANTSHEIRTPMNSILGYCELILRQDQISSETREYAQGIRLSGRNLLYIINDILDISKIEANKMEIIPEEFGTASLMNDIITIAQARIGDKPLKFIPGAAEDVPSVLYGDTGRIRQIIINLVSNAVKYTPKGKVILDFSFERDPSQLVVRVEDTGIGIKQENLSQIFKSFEQVDTKRNRAIEGTGLGLAISQRLAELMGGSISVSSEYGVGSVFTLKVPVKVVDESPMVYSAFSEDSSRPGLAKGRSAASSSSFKESFTAPGARILIVDDNPVNLHVACGLMEVYKMQIVTSESGYDALKVTEDTPFDLIFMDHMMPGMDGVETVKKLRLDAGNRNRETPVVALTANAISGMKEMFLENGFQDYLSKPMELRELDRILKEHLPKDRILLKQEGQAEKEKEAQKAGEREVKALEENLSPLGRELFLRSPLIDEKTAQLYGIEEKKLSLFALSYETSRTEMETAYREKDWESFRIRVHGLKSASLFIGARHLSEMSRAAEDAAKRLDGEYIGEHLEEILKEGDELVRLIQEVQEKEERCAPKAQDKDGEPKGAPVSKEELKEKLGKIREALDLFDAVSAKETAKELSGCTIGKLSLREQMEKLCDLIDLFSYEEAAALLDEMEGELYEEKET